jgi:hypothetical protein
MLTLQQRSVSIQITAQGWGFWIWSTLECIHDRNGTPRLGVYEDIEVCALDQAFR